MLSLIDNIKRWSLVLVLLLGGGLGVAWKAGAQSQSPPEYQEYQVKAAFLYNFAKFVEWPAESFKDAQAPLIIGIIGKDPFGETFNKLRDHHIEGRKLVIKRFAKAEDLEKCHILFISAAEKEHLSMILKITRDWPVLTVGDTKGLVQSGVIINFLIIENKIRFEINTDAAQRAGLKIRSQLLKLAKIHKEKS